MKKQILTAACAAFLSAGIAAAQIHITIAPPPPRHEVIPASPHPGWVWQAGYHRWDGHAYVWVPGAYVEPPHAHARWVPGHWAHRGGEYVWVEGHWR
jgi:hypothetical protein